MYIVCIDIYIHVRTGGIYNVHVHVYTCLYMVSCSTYACIYNVCAESVCLCVQLSGGGGGSWGREVGAAAEGVGEDTILEIC